MKSVAKFLVPDWGDTVDSGIGLSYRPARLHRMSGWYDNTMPEASVSPQSGTKNLASAGEVTAGHARTDASVAPPPHID
jgi:hypothetical protein